jgi:hypothetical protein
MKRITDIIYKIGVYQLLAIGIYVLFVMNTDGNRNMYQWEINWYLYTLMGLVVLGIIKVYYALKEE